MAARRTSRAPSGLIDEPHVAPHAELLGGARQAADRADLDAHEQRGDGEQEAGAAEQPGQEEVDRADVEALAGGVDREHAARELDAEQHLVRVGGPVHGERTADGFAQGGGEVVVHRAEDVVVAARREHRAGGEMHGQAVVLAGLRDRAGASGRGLVALEQVDGLGDLAGDRTRQPAGNDVEVAAVEERQRHAFGDQQRDQDDQQRAAEQGAGEDAAEGTVEARHQEGQGSALDPPPVSTLGSLVNGF